MSALDTRATGGSFDPAKPELSEAPEWFLNYLRSALASPLFSVPKPFETWMIDKVATSGFDLPVSQLVGFTQFTGQMDVQPASPLTQETTTELTYQDLSTVGPSLSMNKGRYLLIFGCAAKTSSAADQAHMSVSLNGAAAADDYAADTSSTALTTVMTATVQDLAVDGENTVVAKYRCEGGSTATFNRRFLIALRLANL